MEAAEKSWFVYVKLVDSVSCKNWANLYQHISLLHLCFKPGTCLECKQCCYCHIAKERIRPCVRQGGKSNQKTASSPHQIQGIPH